MALLIDPPRWPAHGRLWSHLVSDSSLEELHAFAASAGVPRRSFEGDHYDVPQERFAAVVAAGALAVDGRTLVRALQGSGLRRPKRKGERVVSTLADPGWLPRGSRADVVASRQDDPPPNTVLVRLAVVRDDRLLVVDRVGRGPDLPFRALERESVAADTVALAVGDLQRSVLGSPGGRVQLVGYVRNTVPTPTPDYPWPTPLACFTVYRQDLQPTGVNRAGQWLTHGQASSRLAARHWWPLFADGFSAWGIH